MPRASLLPYLIYGLLLTGLLLLDARILVLAVPLLVYIGVSLARTPAAPSWECRRQVVQETIPEGGETAVQLSLTNHGPALEYLLVVDPTVEVAPVAGGTTSVVAALAPGESVTLEYTIVGQRGSIDLPDVQVAAGDTLGLFPHRSAVDTGTRLLVIPSFPHLRRAAIRPLRTMGFSGPIPSRRSGAGTDFFGVRDYQPGDPLRRVNWRATARYLERPFTTEFEQERIADVGLILDMRPELWPGRRRLSLLTYGIQATAAMADVLLRDGHRVGLLLYGHGRWLFPGYGRVQRERILRALATTSEAASYQIFRSLSHLPTRLFAARSQLLFISPLKEDDEDMLFRLRANGYSVMIVSPDPVSFEAQLLGQDPLVAAAARLARLERRLLMQRLRQGGTVVVDWPVTESLDAVVAVALRTAPPIRHVRERPA